MQNEYVNISDLIDLVDTNKVRMVLVLDEDTGSVVHSYFTKGTDLTFKYYGDAYGLALPVASEFAIDRAIEFARAEGDSCMNFLGAYRAPYGWYEGEDAHTKNVSIVYAG